MDIESTINFKRKTGFFEKHKLEFVSFFVYFLFMAFGARAVTFTQVDAYSLVSSQLSMRCGQPFLDVFFQLLISRVIDFFVVFFSGLTVFGAGISFGWIAVVAMKIGIISGGLYKYFGLSGFGCFCAVFLPFCAVNLIIYSVLNSQSVKSSTALFKFSFLGNAKTSPNEMKFYFLRAVILLILICVVSVIEAVAGYFLTGFFI